MHSDLLIHLAATMVQDDMRKATSAPRDREQRSKPRRRFFRLTQPVTPDLRPTVATRH